MKVLLSCDDVCFFVCVFCKCIDVFYLMVRCELFCGFVLGWIFLDFNISVCYFIVFM